MVNGVYRSKQTYITASKLPTKSLQSMDPDPRTPRFVPEIGQQLMAEMQRIVARNNQQNAPPPPPQSGPGQQQERPSTNALLLHVYRTDISHEHTRIREEIIQLLDLIMPTVDPKAPEDPDEQKTYLLYPQLISHQPIKQWRYCVVSEGEVLVDGPVGPTKKLALERLHEELAAKMAAVPRVWDVEEVGRQVGVHGGTWVRK